MNFCPVCGCLLLVETKESRLNLFCEMCPFTHNVKQVMTTTIPLQPKKVDDVMGGAEAWENADKTTGFRCSKCEHLEAYYYQVQIRSADEPATTFLKCVQCGHRWSDNN